MDWNNKEDIKEYQREYHLKHKKKHNRNSRAYTEAHSDRLKEKRRAYYRNNRDKELSKMKVYYRNNTRKILDYESQCRKDNPERYKDKDLRKLYGIGYEQYSQMHTSQSGRCAICTNEFKSGKETHVDHDHKTGQVRQLLCSSCNTGIGYLKEDPVIISRALEYLNKWNSLSQTIS